jgi:hypothetical protein
MDIPLLDMAQRLGDTACMKITCHAEQLFSSEPYSIFDLMVDVGRFPDCFTGYGLIPAIRRIRLNGPLASGSTREIHNADNSVLTEKITLLDRPHRHAYELSGFQMPFSLLVKLGESDWQLSREADQTKVCWTYEFTLTNFLVFPVGFVLLKFFMQRAMQRCLQNMTLRCNAARGVR